MDIKSDVEESAQAVAPGYPTVDSLKNIDASGWEPAAVFQPVDLAESGSADAGSGGGIK